jgi:hypothetical protein
MPVGLVLRSCMFGRCYAQQIFHDGVDNISDKGYADLCLEGGPTD